MERYSKDLYSVVSSIEDDVGSTCRSLGGIQKMIVRILYIICLCSHGPMMYHCRCMCMYVTIIQEAAEDEHVTLVHSLTNQEDKLVCYYSTTHYLQPQMPLCYY